MPLQTGTRLGPYEVVGAIGIGGMGVVYRARDGRLHRDVAIKVLPDDVAHDTDRRARFQREAHLLASLSHSNIAHLYGLEDAEGTPALVMELVEGPTLADRLARGPIPVDEALPIARQIAEALEAAHDAGVIHRDLKPANVKVRDDGTVKVLDFGLAKAMDPPSPGATAGKPGYAMNSPTVTSPAMTQRGVILGTAAYMAPEQAQGTIVDARSDIWAFGVVLYEMLTGQRAFTGETSLEVLSNVLKTAPDWAALPPSTPSSIRSLLRRCLQKDRNRRLRDIADARFQIEEALVEPAGAAVSAPVPRTRERLWWAVALIAALAGGAAGTARYVGVRPAQSSEVRFEITTPPTADPASLAVSPDGRQLVFVGSSDGASRLWQRSLDDISARPLAGTENARFPFWSPDSQSVGFASDGQLKRIDIATGVVRMVTAHIAYGGTWNQDGTILFGGGPGAPVYRVSADGGTWRELTKIDTENSYHRSPQFLPDQRHFLFHVSGSAQGIYIGDLETGNARRLLDADAAVYASGQLLFVRQGTLLAQPFDPAQQQLAGTPTAVVQEVLVRGQGVAALSASATGSIVFRSGPPSAEGHFVWFDRSGKVLETIAGSDGPGFNSALSPDGRWLALNKVTNGNRDLWLLELSRGVPSRFTSDAAFELIPVWSPDGRQLAFASNRRGTMDVYVKPVVGPGSDELLVAIEGASDVPSDWSSDGQFLLYSTDDKDIWALPMRGDRKAFPVVQAPFDELNGQFSPDGRWLAYQSNESGRFEIYVQRFPRGPKTLVSSGGGDQVRWRKDGKEIFYLAPDNGLMAVPIRLDESGDRAEVGAPALLFSPSLSGSPRYSTARHYMASPDGQRFLMDTLKEVTLPITVVMNWNPKP